LLDRVEPTNTAPAQIMPRPYNLGVLFVHGIGQQRRGETLIRFGEPLARAVQDRFSSGAAPDILLPGRPGAVELRLVPGQASGSPRDPEQPSCRDRDVSRRPREAAIAGVRTQSRQLPRAQYAT
jgi:hypothetical protein